MDLRIRSMLVVIVFAGARFLNTDFQEASQYNPAALDSNLNVALGSSQTMDQALGKTIASAGANDISGQRHLYNDIDVSGSNPAPNSQNQTNDKTITLHVLNQEEDAPSKVLINQQIEVAGVLSNEKAVVSRSNPGGNAEIQNGRMLNSHQSPGVGHMAVGGILSSEPSLRMGHWQKTKPSSADVAGKSSTVNTLSSGQSPGVGHAYTDSHTHSSSAVKLDTFNIKPSGPSPGVGHGYTNGQTERVQLRKSEKQKSTFNRLPSGPSPGVGHSYTDAHVDNVQITIAGGKPSEALIKPQSGPSPGAGHSYTDGHMDKISKDKTITFNKLPSGPSPGVGHKYTDGHVQNIQTTVSEEKMSAVFKPHSGPSPGAGHEFKNGHTEKSHVDSVQITIAERKPSEALIKPQSARTHYHIPKLLSLSPSVILS